MAGLSLVTAWSFVSLSVMAGTTARDLRGNSMSSRPESINAGLSLTDIPASSHSYRFPIPPRPSSSSLLHGAANVTNATFYSNNLPDAAGINCTTTSHEPDSNSTNLANPLHPCAHSGSTGTSFPDPTGHSATNSSTVAIPSLASNSTKALPGNTILTNMSLITPVGKDNVDNGGQYGGWFTGMHT